jgi:hypothetical protein
MKLNLIQKIWHWFKYRNHAKMYIHDFKNGKTKKRFVGYVDKIEFTTMTLDRDCP